MLRNGARETKRRISLMATMTKSSTLTPILILCASLSIIARIMPAGAATDDTLRWVLAAAGGGGCSGTVAECMAAGEEFEMDSETSRRILATTDYISYRALQRNTVPCSRRGASYYNCQAGGEANPYSRGCTAATRCRRG